MASYRTAGRSLAQIRLSRYGWCTIGPNAPSGIATPAELRKGSPSRCLSTCLPSRLSTVEGGSENNARRGSVREETAVDLFTSKEPPLPSPPSPVELRLYQTECIDACTRALSDGLTRIAVSAPTGSGKTVIFSTLLKQIPARKDNDGTDWTGREYLRGGQVMILVPSVEIAKQTAASVGRAHPNLTVEIEQGRREATGRGDVTVATVASLAAKEGHRLSKFDPAKFKVVIIDEAHHACADTWRRVLEHFHPAMCQRPKTQTSEHGSSTAPLFGSSPDSAPSVSQQETEHNTPLIGFSATLIRSDGLALGTVFEKIVYHNGMLDLMNSGHLAPLRFTMIRGHLDLSSLRVSSAGRLDTQDGQGDFTGSSMEKALNIPVLNQLLVKTWLYRCWNLPPRKEGDTSGRYRRRSTLVFCATRAHLTGVVDAFRAAGVPAYGVDGSTPSAERVQLVQRFRQGDYPVLVNCGVFTEGTDIPPVDCVLIARPTRSQGRFQQMIGRGTRQSPETGKKDCLVLDYVSAAEGARGAVCAPTLFGLDPQEEDMDEASLEELIARKLAKVERKKKEAAQALENALQTVSADASQPAQAGSPEPNMPTKMTMTDYESIATLQVAIDLRENSKHPVLSTSDLGWTDCGNDLYILTIPSVGRIRLEPNTEVPENILTEMDHEEVETDENENLPIEQDLEEQEEAGHDPMGLDRSPVWLGTFVRQISLPGKRPANARAIKIVTHPDLAGAIRACDTYALKHGGVGRKVMLRSAPWRSEAISEGQSKVISKRLGLTLKGARDMGILQLTRGEAMHMITRLTSGPAKKYARGVVKRLKERQGDMHAAETREAKRRIKEENHPGPAMDVFGFTTPSL